MPKSRTIRRVVGPSMLSLAFCALLLALGPPTVSGEEGSVVHSFYDLKLPSLEGETVDLAAYRGKVTLVVNVASHCGFTSQYSGLEELHHELSPKGFSVLGFPSNDFGGQEPGSLEEIKTFCTSRFDVTFPLMDKVRVRSGAGQHPLYAALTGKGSPFPGEVKWNFTKFLVGRDGRIVARFESADEPDSTRVTEAIEAALAAKPGA